MFDCRVWALLVATIFVLPCTARANDFCSAFDLINKDTPDKIEVTGVKKFRGPNLVAHHIIFDDGATLIFDDDAWQRATIVADEIKVGSGVTITSVLAHRLNGYDHKETPTNGGNGTSGIRDGGSAGPGAEGGGGDTADRLDVVLAAPSISFADPTIKLTIDLSGFQGGNGGAGGDGGRGGDGFPGTDSFTNTQGYCERAAIGAGNGGDGAPGGIGGDAANGGRGGTVYLVGPAALANLTGNLIVMNKGGAPGQPGPGGFWGLGGNAGRPPIVSGACTFVPPEAVSGYPAANHSPGRVESGATAVTGPDGLGVMNQICSR